ncbi:hypothetical protein [Actinoplanes regularis]|uniref:Uncharacterized protein n=1 Tax=Actinoplanes regularis TaxID=52697 RepID=A0A239IW70_9ACTN|nr:hypothetical protein [Actinoplanes regularis]GIE91602.1 hypothetical protein Are01nite_80820 [Actinoplanes regularis]SNS97857.1 hypothetical protein SAMN06264365_13142 [Actinoplanes regularis]
MTGVGDADETRMVEALGHWLDSVLQAVGIPLCEQRKDWYELVRALGTAVHGDELSWAFPYRRGKICRDLADCFATSHPAASIDLEDGDQALNRALARQLETLTPDPFYVSYFHGNLAAVLYRVCLRAVQEVIARGRLANASEQTDPRSVGGRLRRLGFQTPFLAPDPLAGALANSVVDSTAGTIIQAAQIGELRIGGEPNPAIRGDPIVVTVEQAASLYADDTPISGHSVLRVLVEAVGARTVVLQSLRAHVLSRTPPADVRNISHVLGILEERAFALDLDEDPPRLTPVPNQKSARSWSRFFPTRLRGPHPPDFPFTVSPLDPEQLVIRPHTSTFAVTWNLELNWIYKGQRGSIVLDNAGRPFGLRPPG